MDPRSRSYTSIGDASAEADPLLRACFIRTNIGDECLNFGSHRNIVVGKKGSGKSAIFLMGLGADSDVPTVRISPDTHHIDVLAESWSHFRYANVLEHELALECLQVWTTREELMQKLDGTSRVGALGAASEYLAKLREFGAKLSGVEFFGVGLSLQGKQGREIEIESNRSLDAISPLMKRLIDLGARCLILIDDPEQLFPLPGSSERHQQERLAGLLFAAKSLAARFPGAVRPVVFLKLHVYHALKERFEDFDKLRNDVIMLKWTDDDLEQLLRVRLSHALATLGDKEEFLDPWVALFGRAAESEIAALRSYILERLVCGPRDIVFLAQQIVDQQPFDHSAWDAVLNTEVSYSEDQLKEIRREYPNGYLVRTASPEGRSGMLGIDGVIRVLLDAGSMPEEGKSMTAKDFKDFLRNRSNSPEFIELRKEARWLELMDATTTATFLFDTGVLGYWSERDGRFIRPYEVGSTLKEFSKARRWRINPAFWSALGFG